MQHVLPSSTRVQFSAHTPDAIRSQVSSTCNFKGPHGRAQNSSDFDVIILAILVAIVLFEDDHNTEKTSRGRSSHSNLFAADVKLLVNLGQPTLTPTNRTAFSGGTAHHDSRTGVPLRGQRVILPHIMASHSNTYQVKASEQAVISEWYPRVRPRSCDVAVAA